VCIRAMAVDCEIELDLGDGVPTAWIGAAGVEVLWAEVSDDGRGFDPARPVSAVVHGPEGMRERAQLRGRHVDIQSEPRVGTAVRLEASVANGTSGRA
jgi:glucose-6-phosphate-specific signal transduction histidine kinase